MMYGNILYLGWILKSTCEYTTPILATTESRSCAAGSAWSLDSAIIEHVRRAVR